MPLGLGADEVAALWVPVVVADDAPLGGGRVRFDIDAIASGDAVLQVFA
ncbi:hypothetical protein [Streptomyces sp. URMC 123]